MGEDDNTVAIVAIAVSGGAALLVAFIGATFAYLRQRKALGAEAERQDKALQAESQRQVQQLTHDRHLHDLEELRARLDDVIEEGETALHHVCEARLAFNADQRQGYDDHMWQARDHLGQYGNKERRVRLRVGADHVLIPTLVSFRESVQALYDVVHQAVAEDREVSRDSWNVAMGQVAVAQSGVISAGENAVGAQLR